MAAVLLAAGESTRMGSPKPLLEWLGMTLVQYQISQLCEVEEIGEVAVVLGHRAEEVAEMAKAAPGFRTGKVRLVHNPRYRQGKTTSIKAGVESLNSAPCAVLILAVDQPRPAGLLRALVREHLRRKHRITVPTYQGKRGHPPVFDASLLPEILAISEERQGLLEVIQRRQADVREVATDSPLVLADLNTPAAYKRAAALAAGKATSL